MSYRYNFLELPIKRNARPTGLLQNFFFSFSLKTGCRVIALFEAFVSGLQIYMTPEEMGESRRLQHLLVTLDPKESYKNASVFIDNHGFANALKTLVILNSVILILGTELANIPCLMLWLCITILSKTADMIIHIMQGNDLTSMFYLYTSLRSFILKLQDKLRARLSEAEVLYTPGEEV